MAFVIKDIKNTQASLNELMVAVFKKEAKVLKPAAQTSEFEEKQNNIMSMMKQSLLKKVRYTIKERGENIKLP